MAKTHSVPAASTAERRSTGSTSSDNEPAPPTPIKQYNLTRAKYWSYKNLTLTDNSTSQPVYTATTTNSLSRTPQINLHFPTSTPSHTLAAVRLTHSKNLLYKLGPNIDCTPKEEWSKTVSESKLGRCVRFEVRGKVYRWKRTHKRGWGARWWSDRCFKLVEGEGEEGRVVMVYVTGDVLRGLEVGRVLVFAEVDEEMEVVGLAVGLGVVERVRRE